MYFVIGERTIMATWYSSKNDVAENDALVKKRRQAIREAELRHPGKKLGYKDGIMIFISTGLPVPNTPVIKKPNKAQIRENIQWS